MKLFPFEGVAMFDRRQGEFLFALPPVDPGIAATRAVIRKLRTKLEKPVEGGDLRRVGDDIELRLRVNVLNTTVVTAVPDNDTVCILDGVLKFCVDSDCEREEFQAGEEQDSREREVGRAFKQPNIKTGFGIRHPCLAYPIHFGEPLSGGREEKDGERDGRRKPQEIFGQALAGGESEECESGERDESDDGEIVPRPSSPLMKRDAKGDKVEKEGNGV